jgi:hypothetical protein
MNKTISALGEPTFYLMSHSAPKVDNVKYLSHI